MKTFLSLLLSALISAIQRWWSEQRDRRARADAERLAEAVGSVGVARDLESQAQAAAQAGDSPLAPRPGQRRIDPATGRLQVWTATAWRDAAREEDFFDDAILP